MSSARHTRCLALGLLLAAAPWEAARADNAADEADIAFTLGNGHYGRREYERALQQYFLSYRLVPNRNVLFNIARCYEALARLDEAYRYYNDLAVDEALPPEDAPAVRAALERLGPKVALVEVVTQPASADVFVDREDLGSRGRSPLVVAVPPGERTVLVALEGFERGSQAVAARTGQRVKVSLGLSRILGEVSVEGTPGGATVRGPAGLLSSPDGGAGEGVLGALGQEPLRLRLPPGLNVLTVEAPRHLPQRLPVQVKAGQSVAVKVALEPRPPATGRLVVQANREGATVLVDEREVGFTPTVVTLPVGEYTVEVTAPEASAQPRTVEVVEGKETALLFELVPNPVTVAAASFFQVKPEEAPASVSVVSREELVGFGYQTLAEALQAIRGFFFSSDRIYTYAGVRGFQTPGDLNTRIQVLWDGHTTNDVWAGQGFLGRDFDVDLSEVEQLEVVRGPTSLLFGTGAVLGVINVVPRERLPGDRKVEGTVGAGGQRAVKLRAAASLGREGARAHLSVGGLWGDGAETTPAPGGGLVQGLDGERALNATAQVQLGDFTLTARLNSRNKDVPLGALGADVGVPGTRYWDTRAFVEGTYTVDVDPVVLRFRASYDVSRYRGFYAQQGAQEVERYSDSGGADWGTLSALLTARLPGRHRLSLGVEGQGQFVFQVLVRQAQAERFNRYVLGVSLLDDWQVTPWLSLQAGVRLDRYFDLADVAFSPRAAAVVRPYAQGVTKLLVGQAFRAPTLYELHFNDALESVRAPPVPPRPELVTTFELEHAHNFNAELQVVLAGYFNLIDRLLRLQEEAAQAPGCAGGTVQCLVYGNVGRQVRALGAEAEVRWRPSRFTLFSATYSVVSVASDDPGTQLSYPTHLAAVRLLVPLRAQLARLSLQGTYQSARLTGQGAGTGEALLLNVGLSGEVGPLRYFAGLNNLLDARFDLPVAGEGGFRLVPQYGRSFWVELAGAL